MFVLHAHLRDEPADYSAFLRYLMSIAPPARVGRIGERVVAITDIVSLSQSVAEFVIVEGDEESVPLVLDTITGTDRSIDLQRSEVVVTKTYALIDFQVRKALVMYNQRGAKADDLGILLQALLRANPEWEYVELEFAPAVDESFDIAIERFRRITSASATIARPNFDWEDHAEPLLEAADQSHAQAVDIGMRAPRGSSLSRDGGIVAFLRRQVTHAFPFLKDAVVRGYRTDEAAPTSIRLRKHLVHQRVRVPFDDTGHINEASIRDRLRAYWETLREPEFGEDTSTNEGA